MVLTYKEYWLLVGYYMALQQFGFEKPFLKVVNIDFGDKLVEVTLDG